MSHELNADDTMFAVGKSAWHGLGTTLPKGTKLTSADAIALANADWQVAKVALVAAHDGAAVDRFVGLQRSDTGAILSVVGTKYEPLQNRDMFAAFDRYVEAGVLEYETAGTLRSGRRVWILARLALADTNVAGDTVRPYVLLANGHGDGLAASCDLTAVRVECANTLACALACFGDGSRFRHSAGVTRRVVDRLDDLPSLRAAMEAQAMAWWKMASAPAELFDVARALSSILQKPLDQIVGDGDKVRPDRMLEHAGDAFERPIGGQTPATRGTWWGVYQALTQVVTHGHAGSRRSPASRAESAAFGDGARFLERAELVCDMLARSGGRTWEDLIDVPTHAMRELAA